MLYELLTGARPFDGTSAFDTMDNIKHAAPPPMPGVDRDVTDIVGRCLDKAATARYPSSAALGAALAETRRARDAVSPLDLAAWIGVQ